MGEFLRFCEKVLPNFDANEMLDDIKGYANIGYKSLLDCFLQTEENKNIIRKMVK